MAKKSGRDSGGGEAIDRLRAICLALPATTEKLAWGEPTFRVRGKLFAQLDNHHHGADHLAVWLPMPLGAQEGLVYMDPVRYFVPPYVGGRGWVGVRLDRRPSWKTIGDLVHEAYRTVAPPRLVAAFRSEQAWKSSGSQRDSQSRSTSGSRRQAARPRVAQGQRRSR